LQFNTQDANVAPLMQSEQYSVHQSEKTFQVSIGICCHNEERNIARLVEALLSQHLKYVIIKQIIIVSSSTDNTNNIVRDYERKDKRFRLIEQKKREGKTSAINLFLRDASEEILVLINADLIPSPQCIEKLVATFNDSKIGMAGARPIPTNKPTELMGYAVCLQWTVHHYISELNPHNPKLGELIAFRNNIKEMDSEISVDEDWIASEFKKMGFSLRYVAEAIVYNHGPETVSDFISQRRRVYTGLLQLKKKTSTDIPSLKIGNLLRVIPKALNSINAERTRSIRFTLLSICLEFCARLLGAYDFYIKNKNTCVWEMIDSTKDLKKDN
jgi:poly-beta-1,6-N-acetyl-D-glucosamine synthase